MSKFEIAKIELNFKPQNSELVRFKLMAWREFKNKLEFCLKCFYYQSFWTLQFRILFATSQKCFSKSLQNCCNGKDCKSEMSLKVKQNQICFLLKKLLSSLKKCIQKLFFGRKTTKLVWNGRNYNDKIINNINTTIGPVSVSHPKGILDLWQSLYVRGNPCWASRWRQKHLILWFDVVTLLHCHFVVSFFVISY